MRKSILSLCLVVLTPVTIAQSITITGDIDGNNIIQHSTGRNNNQSISIGNKNIQIKNNDIQLEIDSSQLNNTIVIDSSNTDVMSIINCDVTRELNNTDCSNKSFIKESIRIDINNSDLQASKFLDVNIEQSRFQNVDLRGAYVTNSKIISSEFANTDFEDTSFVNIKAYKAMFINSDFSGASLTNVSFRKSRFINVDFDGAQLTNVSFKDSNISPSLLLSAALLTNVELPSGVVCANMDSCAKLIKLD